MGWGQTVARHESVETREEKEHYMFRKTLLIAAAVAMPLGIIAATGGIASAKAPAVNVTNDTVTCTGIAAKASFNPPLTINGGASSNEATTIKGTASGCTTGGTNPVAVTGVKVSGTINSASTHTCGGLTSPTSETGNLTSAFKTSPKSTPTKAVAAVQTVTGGVGGNSHATFTIAFSGVTGAFQGSDNGASTTSDAQTTATISDIAASCGGKHGLKSISIEADTNSGAGPALHLG
jgi:hypothetical protein